MQRETSLILAILGAFMGMIPWGFIFHSSIGTSIQFLGIIIYLVAIILLIKEK